MLNDLRFSFRSSLRIAVKQRLKMKKIAIPQSTSRSCSASTLTDNSEEPFAGGSALAMEDENGRTKAKAGTTRSCVRAVWLTDRAGPRHESRTVRLIEDAIVCCIGKEKNAQGYYR